jgi:hypothetical protein
MTIRVKVLPLSFGLSAVLCLSSRASGEEKPAPLRPAVRVYTNADLERVHPYRDETGVASVPAESDSEPESGHAPSDEKARRQAEAYWRREAARVRDRVRKLEVQAADVRAQLSRAEEEARRSPTRARGSSALSPARLTARLRALERRMRQMEDDLRERARRERALPGWLR